MPTPTDRYEPLPGLSGLPGHLLRKLSPRGRKIAAVIGVTLLAGSVGAAIALAPRISESKREQAAAERRARIRANKQERARLIAEQRPRRGRLQLNAGAGAGTVVTEIERAITRDARARAAGGELQNQARHTNCRSLGRQGQRLLLACTAVTSETRTTEDVSGVVVGYSYRAAVSSDTGRFAFCKASGRPAVGFGTRELPTVELPRACSG
jgi:hypothetical protein